MPFNPQGQAAKFKRRQKHLVPADVHLVQVLCLKDDAKSRTICYNINDLCPRWLTNSICCYGNKVGSKSPPTFNLILPEHFIHKHNKFLRLSARNSHPKLWTKVNYKFIMRESNFMTLWFRLWFWQAQHISNSLGRECDDKTLG